MTDVTYFPSALGRKYCFLLTSMQELFTMFLPNWEPKWREEKFKSNINSECTSSNVVICYPSRTGFSWSGWEHPFSLLMASSIIISPFQNLPPQKKPTFLSSPLSSPSHNGQCRSFNEGVWLLQTGRVDESQAKSGVEEDTFNSSKSENN